MCEVQLSRAQGESALLHGLASRGINALLKGDALLRK